MRTLDREDVKGQLVRVFNAADGKVALEAPASPALDAGGNVGHLALRQARGAFSTPARSRSSICLPRRRCRTPGIRQGH